MDKWATIAIVYNEIDFIKGWVENKKALGFDKEDMLVMVSEKPFFGKEYPDDGTIDYLEEEEVPYITGVWEKDDPMLNAGISMLKGYDWVLFISPDEYLTKEDFLKVKQICAKGDKPAYAIETMNTYFKTCKHRVEPREDYKPIIAIKTSERFVDIRSVKSDNYGMLDKDIVLYHFAYFRPDYKIKQKMENFSHADITLANWYEDIWLKWTEDMRDFHPTHPEQYKGVIVDEPPKEVTDYINSHSMLNKKHEPFSGNV